MQTVIRDWWSWVRWTAGFPQAPQASTPRQTAFDAAMQRWQASSRLWELAQQYGTRPDQIAAARAEYDLDAANVRALYQQADR